MDDAFLILTLWFLLVAPQATRLFLAIPVPKYWHIPKSCNNHNIEIVTEM